MSNDAGDASSRLSDALDSVFSSRRQQDDPVHASATSGEVGDEPYVLPDIVPATDEPEMPRLPDRGAATSPGPAAPAPVAETTPRPAPVEAVPPAPAAVPTGVAPMPQPPSSAPPAPATGWADHMTTATPASSQLRASGRRPRVRRVTRVLRHVDPWSTFKVALLFSAVGYVVALTSGVLLWRVADSTGTLDNVERWFTQFGWEIFELKGDEIFHNAWIIGLFGVVASTGVAVLLVTLFNLVSDIVGGVRLTVLEEEVVERTISSTRRYVVRSSTPDPTSPGGARTPTWSVDDDPADDDPVVADRAEADPADRPRVGTADRTTTTVTETPVSAEATREQPAASWSVD